MWLRRENSLFIYSQKTPSGFFPSLSDFDISVLNYYKGRLYYS